MPHNAKDSEKMGTQRRLSRLDVFTVNAAYGVDGMLSINVRWPYSIKGDFGTLGGSRLNTSFKATCSIWWQHSIYTYIL